VSSSIWTRCAGSSEAIRPLSLDAWRAVEAQHQIATRKLVDSDEEQMALEEILERYKPPQQVTQRLHYLLATPFRYPPLPHGSRFGSRHEPGIWYGSEALRTVFAEVAYYRLLFLEGTEADLGTLEADLTVFSAGIRTNRGVDLTVPPFERWRRALTSKTSYAATRPLGAALRRAEIEAVRHFSARDVEIGVNVAVLGPHAFTHRRPRRLQTWRCVANRTRVELRRRDYLERAVHRFPRADFLVRDVLPRPAV
jgi:hypothetical protein